MLSLHPHQSASLDDIRALFRRGVRSVLYQLPTGGGKTFGAVEMIRTAAERGKRAWFTVHRRELVRQSVAAFAKAGVRVGVVQAGERMDTGALIQVCAIDTLRHRWEQLPPPHLLLVDEAHHAVAATWNELLKRFPAAHIVGLTATPERLDGKGLRGHFEAMVRGPSMQWLIANGFLVDYELFVAPAPDLTEVHKRAGDYAKGELDVAMAAPRIVGDAIAHYQQHAMGRSTLLFAASRVRSKAAAEAFNAAGIAAAHVDGETDTGLREEAIRDLESGRLKVLCNVDLFGEGVSVNNVSCIIQMRPTQSLTLHLQQIGRGLRMDAGKTNCVILDHAGNYWRHGLPDTDRDWCLDGAEERAKTEAPKGPGVRICTHCFAAIRSGVPICTVCGALLPTKPREIEDQEGELVKVSKAEVERMEAERARTARREEGQADSLEALQALGKARGYKPGWALHRWAARMEKDRARKARPIEDRLNVWEGVANG